MYNKKISANSNGSQELLRQQIETIKRDNNQLKEKVKLLKQELLDALKSKQKYKSKYKNLKQKFETLKLIQGQMKYRSHSHENSRIQRQTLADQTYQNQQNPYQMRQKRQSKHLKQQKLIKSQSNIETRMANSLRSQFEQREHRNICKQVNSVNLKIQKIQTLLNTRLEKDQQRNKQDRKLIIYQNEKAMDQFTRQILDIKKILEGIPYFSKETLQEHSIMLQSNNYILKKEGIINNISTSQTLNAAKQKGKAVYRTSKNTLQSKKVIASKKKLLMDFGKQLQNFRFNTEDSLNQEQ